MKKFAVFALSALFSATALAGADHYVRKEGGLTQHLKVSKIKREVNVMVDVDYEPAAGDAGQPCSEDFAGEAKAVSENELVLKKQAQGEAHYCQLTIHLSGDEAKIDDSADCASYFSGQYCRFGSDGKALTKIK
jgi:hypothetical protein